MAQLFNKLILLNIDWSDEQMAMWDNFLRKLVYSS